MIALARYVVPDDVAAEARKRVGGRALKVSEYASRLVDAIDELVALVEDRGDPEHPLSPGEFDRIIELDGRIEALRISLKIDQIEARIFHKPILGGVYGRRNDTVGYTKIGISIKSDCWVNDDPKSDEKCAAVDDDWRLRMKSLKAIAQEFSLKPQLDPEEEEIVALIVEMKRRLTTMQILSEFSRRGKLKGESTIKGKLAQLTKRRVLVNRSDTIPKGYGLPEWS